MNTLEGRAVKIRDNEKTRHLGIVGKMGLVIEKIRAQLSVRVNGLPIAQILNEEDVELEPLRGRLFLTKSGQQVIVNKIILEDPLAKPPTKINRFLSSPWERRYKVILATPISDLGQFVDTINGVALAGLMDYDGNWTLDCRPPDKENPAIFNAIIAEEVY